MHLHISTERDPPELGMVDKVRGRIPGMSEKNRAVVIGRRKATKLGHAALMFRSVLRQLPSPGLGLTVRVNAPKSLRLRLKAGISSPTKFGTPCPRQSSDSRKSSATPIVCRSERNRHRRRRLRRPFRLLRSARSGSDTADRVRQSICHRY